MKRSIERAIDKRKNNIPSAYELTENNIEELKLMADGEADKLIINAFIYGYEMGVRASSRNHANKRRD